VKKINLNKLNNRGFALIELIIVIALIALAFMGMYNLFSGGMKSWTTGSSQINAQQNIRMAMDKMIREIRHAGYGVKSGEKIPLKGSDQIKFKVDFELDGTLKEIHYYLVGGVLYKSINGSGIPVTNSEFSIKYLIFDYYIPDTNVELITITMEVDSDKDGKTDFTLKSEVKPRNL
jgi:prepilin-type N-terminal cleavage/methylation domain-containing protein